MGHNISSDACRRRKAEELLESAQNAIIVTYVEKAPIINLEMKSKSSNYFLMHLNAAINMVDHGARCVKIIDVPITSIYFSDDDGHVFAYPHAIYNIRDHDRINPRTIKMFRNGINVDVTTPRILSVCPEAIAHHGILNGNYIVDCILFSNENRRFLADKKIM